MDREKPALRRSIKANLSSLPDTEYEQLSAKVRTNCAELIGELSTDSSVHTAFSYAAVPSWREVDVAPLEAEFPDISFDYAACDAQAPLPQRQYDVIFVPLYGFTEGKYRLGHGSGWYDRFLPSQPGAQKIGVGFESQRVDFLAEPHDVPLDAIVTESQTRQ
jgi:5-formyltetrahydrofolate cyclo-ligase